MTEKTVEQLNQEIHNMKDKHIERLYGMYQELLSDYTKLYEAVCGKKK